MHPPDQILAGSFSQQAVFQAMRRGDKGGDIPGHPAVHCNRVAKMRMGIKKGGADPYPGCPGILFNCGDDPALDDNINRPEGKLFSNECLSG